MQNFFGAGSSPVVEGDLLIAMVGGSPPGSPGIHSGQVVGNGTGIVAFDKTTGDVRYAVSDELAGYASPVIRTIAGRRWGFVFARGGLVGFDPISGAIDFHFPWKARPLQSVNASNPVVVDDTVFITESYGRGSALLRVKPGGYEVIRQDGRRNLSLATHYGNVVSHDGILYGSHGRHEGPAELRAVDHATGEIRWSEPGLLWTTLLHVGRASHSPELGRPLAPRRDDAGGLPCQGVRQTGPGRRDRTPENALLEPAGTVARPAVPEGKGQADRVGVDPRT